MPCDCVFFVFKGVLPPREWSRFFPLKKSFSHSLRFQVFKYSLKNDYNFGLQDSRRTLLESTRHFFDAHLQASTLKILQKTRARYAGCQPLSTRSVHSFVDIFIFLLLVLPFEVDDQIFVSCREHSFFLSGDRDRGLVFRSTFAPSIKSLFGTFHIFTLVLKTWFLGAYNQ
jgi:hypothetical protein